MIYWIVVLSLFIPMLILGFDKKSSKAFGILFLSILFILFGFNHGNNDYSAYLAIFYNPETYAEVGYVLLTQAVKYIGGNHNYIVLILGFIWTLTILRLGLYWKVNLSVFLLSYFIYPFLFDITQIRNTMMMVFVLNGMIAVAKNNYKTGLILAVAGAFFHNFGLFYIIIFLLYKLNPKTSRKFWIISILLILTIPFLITNVVPILPFERVKIGVQSYLAQDIKYQSLLVWGLDYIVYMFIATRILRYAVLNPNIRVVSEEQKNKIFVLYKFMIIHAIFLGFLVYFFEFNRIFRNAYIIRNLLLTALLPFMSFRTRIMVIMYLFVNPMVFSFLSTLNLDGDYGYDEILRSNYVIDLFGE